MSLRTTLRRLDWALLGSTVLLTLLGVVLLATAGEATGARALAARQGVFFGVALFVVLLLSRTHYSVFRSLAGLAYVLGLLLLVASLVQGHVVRGAAAWVILGGTRLQPAEFMKVALVLVLARIVSGNRGRTLSTGRMVASLLALALPTALILRQPDVGTAFLLAAAAVGMLVVAGMSRRQVFVLAGGGALCALLAWNVLLVPYQKERLFVFLDPQRDPAGVGYAVRQARTAFGSGGLAGRGLGWGPQSRLNFLPEAHTDFVFARIGEELGFVGAAMTLGLFGLLFNRVLCAARRTSDPFGRALVTGSALTLFAGTLVNVGMNVGLLPVTGVPLPFVSYGGSSLFTSYVLLGFATSVVIHGERWEETPEEEAALLVPGAL